MERKQNAQKGNSRDLRKAVFLDLEQRYRHSLRQGKLRVREAGTTSPSIFMQNVHLLLS